MKKIILIIIIIIIIAGSWYAYKEYNRKNADLTEVNASQKINATELLKAFETNYDDANKKFLGKIVSVTGTIKSIEKEANHTTIVLGDPSSMSSIRCSMDTTYTSKIIAKENEMITIKGNCTGYNQNDISELGSDVILTRCVITNN